MERGSDASDPSDGWRGGRLEKERRNRKNDIPSPAVLRLGGWPLPCERVRYGRRRDEGEHLGGLPDWPVGSFHRTITEGRGAYRCSPAPTVFDPLQAFALPRSPIAGALEAFAATPKRPPGGRAGKSGALKIFLHNIFVKICGIRVGGIAGKDAGITTGIGRGGI